jgi:Sec-independent protein translocase protein TatA
MRINLPVVYSQNDDRWKAEWLGFNIKLPYNIGNYGCLDSCLAMVCKYFGKNENPLTLNNLLKEKKGFVANGGEYVWGAITKCYPDIKEKMIQTPSLLTDGQVQEIKTTLDNGMPVVCQIDYNPKTNQPDMHFVVVVDYNHSDENDFTIADPINGKIRSLKDYLGFWKPNARNTIERYITYEGKKPAEVAGQVSVSQVDYKIFNFVKEQWIKLISYLEMGTDPNLTPFEDVQRVIGGFKSRVTDVQKQLDFSNTEVKNREEQVSRLKDQLLEDEKLQKALNIKLNEALKSSSSMTGLYEGRIATLQGQVDTISKEKGALNNKITQQETEIKELKIKVDNLSLSTIEDMSSPEVFVLFIKKLLSLKKGGGK